MTKTNHNVPSTGGFYEYLSARWKASTVLSTWYTNPCHRMDRFFTYRKRQRVDARVVSNLKRTFGENAIFGYGTWGNVQCSWMKGLPPCPNKYLLRLIRSKFRCEMIDERYTSQTCCHCGYKAIPVKKSVCVDGRSTFRKSLLRCTNVDCKRFLCRDKSAAVNIYDLLYDLVVSGEKVVLKPPPQGSFKTC